MKWKERLLDLNTYFENYLQLNYWKLRGSLDIPHPMLDQIYVETTLPVQALCI